MWVHGFGHTWVHWHTHTHPFSPNLSQWRILHIGRNTLLLSRCLAHCSFWDYLEAWKRFLKTLNLPEEWGTGIHNRIAALGHTCKENRVALQSILERQFCSNWSKALKLSLAFLMPYTGLQNSPPKLQLRNWWDSMKENISNHVLRSGLSLQGDNSTAVEKDQRATR